MKLDYIFSLPRKQKKWLQIAFDSIASSACFVLLASVISGFSAPSVAELGVCLLLAIAAPLLLSALGAYKAIIRYLPAAFMIRFLVAAALISCAGYFAELFFLPTAVSERFYLDLVALLFVVLSTPRILFRWLFDRGEQKGIERAIVYGAGSAGRQLVSALASGNDFRVVAFVDDEAALQGATISGVRVYRPSRLAGLVDDHQASVVLLALPSASTGRRRKVVSRLEDLPVRVQSIPGMADVVSGKARISELRDISIEDLLGRDPVAPIDSLIQANVAGKHVMVTGAGGSIGSELARQALVREPAMLVLFDHSEFLLYSVESELQAKIFDRGWRTKIVAVLGSVLDGERLKAVLSRYSVHTVYHAAAYKHVPLVEHNPVEGLRNNVLGTLGAARAAVAAGVESFVLISTDKAVRPTNVMGASKRFAELGVQAAAKEFPGTHFSIVRFGNVLGSSGSVVPRFRSQISEGGPITVTHPDIIRYFMTIPEAAQLVIQAGALETSGEVYVLDMGASIRIVDLASRMIRLAGYSERTSANPDGDIEVQFTGLRPGEKLYEELLIDDCDRSTMHPRIRVCAEPCISYSDYLAAVGRLESYLEDGGNTRLISALLMELPLGWAPSSSSINDHGESADTKLSLHATELSALV